ncbi:hypothetical protein E3O25_14515 [Cryobacterium sp. TMT1-3]|uniref:Uncharacterized protein n=1 Tax=Cryobacterium luteum TaxID=1424661 RepID=A0A1H8A3T9_9MICO|nr:MULTISPECIES: hypothetical protein [Cryobacterium]TFB88371.1 hypothetical protein E3O10_11160 [Cryobacterium luteum]TFC24399.1 hypothetical protein E3O25_14515 [Cryobacterium sp. TMT1-3]SEM65223.1 hypothetical protein SAMN05216281_1019 [Cryobacterium luteum]
MIKKLLATLALVGVALLAGPVAAHAAGYVAADLITVSGSQSAGSTVTVAFNDGAFTAAEKVAVAVSGEGSVTLAALRATTVDTRKTATGAGALDLKVTLPTGATGSYTLTATGLSSQNVGTATITVAAADGTDLAAAGFDLPIVLIFSAAGALLLGVGLVIALRLTLRRRAATV